MPTVMDILHTKGDTLHTIAPRATVLEAIVKMNREKIGALLVMDDMRLVGMFTERDVLRRVAGELLFPADVHVEDVMTRDVICCTPETEMDEAAAIMKQRRVRHLPVVSRDGQLYGLISIGDINAYHLEQAEAQISFLNEYIYGRA
jgi:CBS domain-containing protein